ncbi:MAG TPA: response regulator, partial [Ramlibacter sp.]|nr:response regulator [Ramlibacter sp.]
LDATLVSQASAIIRRQVRHLTGLVELHGGTVALHSEGRGRGSTFSVRLPQLPPDFRAPAAEPPPATGAVAQRSLRVMVVDDNADAAQTLAMLIRSMGHQASVVLDSHQALLQGESERPEVFVLDIGLPDMNGHELARRLRAQPATASAVLIAITGYGQEQDRDEALQAGFDHHFVKPVDRGLLEALLAQVAKA